MHVVWPHTIGTYWEKRVQQRIKIFDQFTLDLDVMDPLYIRLVSVDIGLRNLSTKLETAS